MDSVCEKAVNWVRKEGIVACIADWKAAPYLRETPVARLVVQQKEFHVVTDFGVWKLLCIPVRSNLPAWSLYQWCVCGFFFFRGEKNYLGLIETLWVGGGKLSIPLYTIILTIRNLKKISKQNLKCFTSMNLKWSTPMHLNVTWFYFKTNFCWNWHWFVKSTFFRALFVTKSGSLTFFFFS